MADGPRQRPAEVPPARRARGKAKARRGGRENRQWRGGRRPGRAGRAAPGIGGAWPDAGPGGPATGAHGRTPAGHRPKGEKAESGKSIINELSAELTKEYGKGYGQRNLFNMVKFYDTFPDDKILQTLSAKLSWSHFVKLLSIAQSETFISLCASMSIGAFALWRIELIRCYSRERLYLSYLNLR